MWVLCGIINHTICVIYYREDNLVGVTMVKNNIEIDVKTKCIEEGITQAMLAEKANTSAQYVNKVMKKADGVVNKTFVIMMEKLGYDIRLMYVKRRDKDNT